MANPQKAYKAYIKGLTGLPVNKQSRQRLTYEEFVKLHFPSVRTQQVSDQLAGALSYKEIAKLKGKK